MVVMFLFYSGYGILESYKQKREYEQDFFKKRFCKTWLHFDIAILLYLVTGIVLGIKYDPINYVFCWIGWKAIGNSKWFVFDILALYMITFTTFKIINTIAKNKENKRKLVLLTWLNLIGTVMLIIILFFFKNEEGSYWYDTLLSYPCGMLFSCYRHMIEAKMKTGKYWGITIVMLTLFIVFYKNNSFITHNICSCLFAVLIISITMKVKCDNIILLWFGNRAFSIYILQRLPMMIMTHFGLNLYRYSFSVISIVFTIILAWMYEKLLRAIDKKLYNYKYRIENTI